MNQATKAAVALALGIGLAGAAQAHGVNLQGNAGTMQPQAAMSSQAQPLAATNGRLSRQQIRRAQHLAWLRSHHRLAARAMPHHPLHRTAGLHHKPLDRQMGSQAIGVGSSMPPKANATTGTQMMPPATTPSGGGNDAKE